jgi:DHA2 family multidrug resistance protein
MISMMVVGRLVGKVDTRFLMTTGLVIFAVSYAGMSHFSLQMGPGVVAWTGFVQGLGTGMVFTPMTIVAYATLNPALRTDGTGVFALLRNVGNSAGISLMETVFTRTVQVVHSRLVQPLTPDNPLMRGTAMSSRMASSAASMNGEVTRQAAMVAYVDVYHLMFVTTLCLIPLVFLMRSGRHGAAPSAAEMVVE